ncbi:MAG: hypothetical protein U0Q11_22555 [Vicinamibacterales bacterium]
MTVAALLMAGAATARSAHAQTSQGGRIGITFEGLFVGQQRNDVRIPPVGGTDFSIVDLIGAAPTRSMRVELTTTVTERQELRFVYAPLRISGSGTSGTAISFAGTLFPPAPTDAEYQFSSYRGTWRYRVHQGDTWTWRIGFTGFVRDARIALSQAGRSAENTDVGFVPLGHISAEAALAKRWRLAFELDGTAAPQGRAFDGAASVQFRPLPRWTLAAGYRTIEGGADVSKVYTFAWLNAVTVSTGIRF